ncbi:hypothetical protein [Sphingomonas sp. GB1N7]|uniref:hypothetical protein n=1 Tax=Parasphingomonas caseinilytica TaxID=3096158 RepID=UPI002FCB17F9
MKTTLKLLPIALIAAPVLAQKLSFKAVQPDPAAVRIMDVYARCVVARNPDQAIKIISSDYRTDLYRAEIRDLAMKQKSCVPRAGKLKFQPVIFAGMMAEDLMRRSHADISDLGRLPTPSKFNGAIECVVQTEPKLVSELFRTTPASSEELTAIFRLQPTLNDCLPREQAPLTNNVILRAQLALASYRFMMLNSSGV